jgi:hypothetical protein
MTLRPKSKTGTQRFDRLLKNCAQGRHSALRGARHCSHMPEYAALAVSPRALLDGPILVFQHPDQSAEP